MESKSRKVLITGGTGLIGKHLAPLLQKAGYAVFLLSRSGQKGKSYIWNIKEEYIEKGALENLYGVIHLAGAGIADKRWTNARRRKLLTSRTESSGLLIRELKKQVQKPSVFIGMSAIGYYGMDTGNVLIDETTPPGSDFLAELVKSWEASYHPVDELGIRKALIRTGIVLSKDGGALSRLAAPVKLGLGAALGNGKQWMSWIHIDDLCRIFLKILDDESWAGIYNGVAPNPVTNNTLTHLAAKTLKRPVWLPPVPGFALKLALGDLAEIVLGGNKISCQKLLDHGFQFSFTEAELAIQDIL